MASMLRGLEPYPGRPHQATPLTWEGCLRLCRHSQPEPDPESDSASGLAHSFTISSLAQVSKIWPLGLHFILVMDSWKTHRVGSVKLTGICTTNLWFIFFQFTLRNSFAVFSPFLDYFSKFLVTKALSELSWPLCCIVYCSEWRLATVNANSNSLNYRL